MDLKIKDVAELFDVTETTVERWISDGKIPTYRFNKLHPDHRFSITEMEYWVISHKIPKTKETPPKSKVSESNSSKIKINRGGVKQFSLFRAIHKGDVLKNIPGHTKEDVIRTTMKRSSKPLNLDAEVVTELLLNREKLMPTALNNGIGIPHTRDTKLNSHHDVVVIVFPEHPLEYGALDGKPVHTLFFLFATDDKRHLHLLAKIAHLSSQPEALELFKQKPSKEEVLHYIKEWENSL